MKAISFFLLLFSLGLASQTGAQERRVEVCPAQSLQRISCELYLEAERLLRDRGEAVYKTKNVFLYLFRPEGDFILFVPVPRDVSARLFRFRVYYLSRSAASVKWHGGSVIEFTPKERYVVDEAPLPGEAEPTDEKTLKIFLESLQNSKEFASEYYF